MEFRQQNMNLSFSIENILRDDFPHRQRSLPLTPCYERWPNSAVYGQYYAAHYSPVIMKCLPDMPHRVEKRLQRVNGPEEQISEERNTISEEDCSSCKDESVHHKSDAEINDREVKEPFKLKTCSSSNEKGARERKRRHRSHFTQHQLQYLEKLFSRQKYLTRDERTLLARSLEMTELQIRNWFQNRRYLKRHRANENAKQVKKLDSKKSVRV